MKGNWYNSMKCVTKEGSHYLFLFFLRSDLSQKATIRTKGLLTMAVKNQAT